MATPPNPLALLDLEASPEALMAARAAALRKQAAQRPATAEEAGALGAIGPGAALSPSVALAEALRNRTPNTGAYELFSGDDEGAVRNRAEGVNLGLGRQRAAGNLGLLTGDEVLSGFGQAQLQGADRQEAMLADAGQFRAGQTLKKALEVEEAKRQARIDSERERHNRVMESRPPSNVFLPGAGGQYYLGSTRGDGPVIPLTDPTGTPVLSPKADEIRLAEEKLKADAAAREAQIATAEGNKVAADTKDVAEAFDKSGGPGFYAKYEEVSGLLKKYPKDIPGFGKADGRVPDMFVGEDALAMRQGVGQMLAEYRKGITGAGMSNAERTEYGQITGLLQSNNERSVRQGVERLKGAMDARVQAMAGGFRPEAVQTYGQRVPAFGAALRGSPVAPAASQPKVGTRENPAPSNPTPDIDLDAPATAAPEGAGGTVTLYWTTGGSTQTPAARAKKLVSEQPEKYSMTPFPPEKIRKKQYSKKANATRTVDGNGNVISVEEGDTRGR